MLRLVILLKAKRSHLVPKTITVTNKKGTSFKKVVLVKPDTQAKTPKKKTAKPMQAKPASAKKKPASTKPKAKPKTNKPPGTMMVGAQAAAANSSPGITVAKKFRAVDDLTAKEKKQFETIAATAGEAIDEANIMFWHLSNGDTMKLSDFKEKEITLTSASTKKKMKISNKYIVAMAIFSDRTYPETMENLQRVFNTTGSIYKTRIAAGEVSFTDKNKKEWDLDSLSQVQRWCIGSDETLQSRAKSKSYDAGRSSEPPPFLKTVMKNETTFTGDALYRGVHNFPAWALAEKGNVLPFSLGSFSESQGQARWFADRGNEDNVPVVIVLPKKRGKNIRGVSVPELAAEVHKRREMLEEIPLTYIDIQEKEWIVRSPFLQVTKIEKATKDSPKKVYVEVMDKDPNLDKSVEDRYSTKIWDMQKVFDQPLHRKEDDNE